MRPLRLALVALFILAAVSALVLTTGRPDSPHTDTPSAATHPTTAAAPEPSATPTPSQPPTAQPTTLHLPPQDHPTLLADARAYQDTTGRHRFATRLPVHLTPDTHGRWSTSADGHTATWQLDVDSPGATSLNFAFSTFHLPPGGQLTLTSPRQTRRLRPFTTADHEPHGQLWTPLVRGGKATLTATVPAAEKPALKLVLAAVNHGFRGLLPGAPQTKAGARKIGGDTSGACNIDVACASAGLPVSPMIQAYADQVRSVGAYTIGGTDTCSGALVNNTALDGRPFFLTADHCGISASNAASVVVYWNFQHPACRTPGSAASGGVGDGPLDQFNTGSIFRATSSRSDFCLIELDDPLPESANAFFAGWDRSGDPVTSSVGIHHPAVAEKRISFDFDPATTTAYYGNSTSPDGTHLRVADWDDGTTEGGSSGSPLFDQHGRIVGQLHGGDAACGNDDPDWYGRVAVSWDGDGTPESRLSDWLDPLGTGAQRLDGLVQDERLTVTGTDTLEGAPGGTNTLTFTVTLSPAADETVTVLASTTADGTAAPGTDFTAVENLTLTFPPGTTGQTVTVDITGDDTPEEHETVALVLASPVNATAATAPVTARVLNDDYIPPVLDPAGPFDATVGRTLTFTATAANTPTSYSLTNPPAGASVDPTTGLVSFTPATTGPATLAVNAANPAGSDTVAVAVEVGDNPLLLALDLDAATSPAAFQETGSDPWDLTRSTTWDGVDSARSAGVPDGGISSFRLAFDGPEAVSFYWRVSSEVGYDFLEVLADGSVHDAISGSTGWRQQTVQFPEPGPHTLEFRYAKDGSDSDGSDAGWVDAITFASTSATPFLLSPETATTQRDVPFSYTFTFFEPPASLVAVGAEPPGLTFDPATATLSGTPPGTGTFPFTVRAAGAGAPAEFTLTLSVIPPLYPALDLPASIPVSTSAAAPWETTLTTTNDGVDAARSGAPGDGGQSDLSITVDGPDTVAFWWRVSSEESFDFLQLLLDGELQQEISGEVGWEQRSLKIPGGPHTLTWRYTKDGSAEEGNDRAWLDGVVLASQATVPVVIEPAPFLIERDQPFTFAPTVLGTATTFSATGLPPGLDVDPATGTVTGTPTTTGDFTATLTAGNASGDATATLEFQVVPPIGPALGQPDLAFTPGGDAPWVTQSSTVHSGDTAARSGRVGDDESSVLSATIDGPATGSFWWRVSSEEDFDVLEFTIDGAPVASITGRTSWENVPFDLPGAGPHTLTWTYRKDGSDSDGSDAGWLDSIVIEPAFTPLTAWLDAAGLPVDTNPVLGDPPLLARFALGLPATGPVDLSTALVLDPDSSPPTFTVRRDPDRTADVTVTVEASPDLSPGSWSTDLLETVTDTPAQLTVRPAPGAPATLYLRPRYTQPIP